MSDSTKLAIFGATIMGGAALLVAPVVAFMVTPRDASPDTRPNAKLANLLRDDLGSEAKADDTPEVVRNEAKWRTIKGVVRVSGPAPPLKEINVTTSDSCGPQYDWSMVVNQENKGIKNLVIYVLKGIAKNDVESPNPVWVHPQYKNIEPEPLYDQEKCKFLEHMFVAQLGQTITLKNSDPFPHNVNISPSKGRKFDNLIQPGGVDKYPVEEAVRTPFKVKCAIHKWMEGYMLFRDNPYYAVTDENGEFVIENVPADADLEFRAAHEKIRVGAVEVNGKAEKWSKGGFELNLEPDADGNPYELNIVLK